MSDCELRRATTDDTDSVYVLICELLSNKLDRQAFREGFAANLQDPHFRYHLALWNGEVVGMIGLHMQFHLHHANWIGEIQELVVLPQMRGQKVGSQLLAWAEEEARRAGAELTELSSSIKRHDAHRFYLREGYTQSHFRFTKML
ncbi:TPA: aminoalkylphosphonate N-acetyltransferase [Salmonella enterica subsp. salamae serovar 28:r:e,n,z15]|nr:aminoalkylphosphonate N-acetyltransferase [Salmonella enterica subsp. salamae serovar 28:r:e,n,z15]